MCEVATEVNVNLAGVRVLEQARDVEQRRFAGAGRRNQCHRLAAPDRQLGTFENFEGVVALTKPPHDRVQENDRIFLAARRRRRRLSASCRLIHRS